MLDLLRAFMARYQTMSAGTEERRIRELFTVGESLKHKNEEHEILIADKPSCVGGGEPKTDIFIRLKSTQGIETDLKISFKMRSADFLENKISADRARDILGENWNQIIKDLALNLKAEFHSKKLIFKERYRRTKRGSFTLGWKFEFVNADSGGTLSCRVPLSESQVLDVYAGSNLRDIKKNAQVDGDSVLNSGVANYILIESSSILTAQDVLNQMVSVDEYAKQNSVIFCAFKAQNYRSIEDKVDGNRPLAVYVNWEAKQGQLFSTISWEEPLETRSDTIRDQLLDALASLGVSNTDELTDHIIGNVNVHG